MTTYRSDVVITYKYFIFNSVSNLYFLKENKGSVALALLTPHLTVHR